MEWGRNDYSILINLFRMNNLLYWILFILAV